MRLFLLAAFGVVVAAAIFSATSYLFYLAPSSITTCCWIGLFTLLEAQNLLLLLLKFGKKPSNHFIGLGAKHFRMKSLRF